MTVHVPTIAVVVDRTDERSLMPFRDVMPEPMYQLALRTSEAPETRFFAAMLSPSGGFAVVPLGDVNGVALFQRLMHDIAYSSGNVYLLRDEFDPVTESALARDLHEITGLALNGCGHA